MEKIAIIISVLSLIVSTLALVSSLKSQRVQDKVNELDIKLKNLELNQKENMLLACVQARVYKVTRNEYRMKVWNSGNTPAYNVTVALDKKYQIFILDNEKLPFEILEGQKSFELCLRVHSESARKFCVITNWEDEKGSRSDKQQLCDI